MAEYRTYYDGEMVTVYDFDKCIKALQCRNADNVKRIKYLEEENRKLKEEYSKDEEIQSMQQRLDEMKKDYWRGFPITEVEQKAIEEWKKKHDEEVHGYTTDSMRMKAEGCCGGRYVYKFLPTSISTIGTIKCHCGAEFTFQDMF
jgi:predicted nuclease with TOPRIM domain